MKKANVNEITKTALLLAIIAMIQMFGRFLPNSNFIVGSIVNACLLISVAAVGLRGAALLSILSPLTSLINNHAPIAAALLPFAPFIAAGNFLYALIFYLLMKKSKLTGIVVGSLAKFALLYAAINLFLNLLSFPKFAKILLMLFSWPQLITALIGGAIALAVIKNLEKSTYLK